MSLLYIKIEIFTIVFYITETPCPHPYLQLGLFLDVYENTSVQSPPRLYSYSFFLIMSVFFSFMRCNFGRGMVSVANRLVQANLPTSKYHKSMHQTLAVFWIRIRSHSGQCIYIRITDGQKKEYIKLEFSFFGFFSGQLEPSPRTGKSFIGSKCVTLYYRKS